MTLQSQTDGSSLQFKKSLSGVALLGQKRFAFLECRLQSASQKKRYKIQHSFHSLLDRLHQILIASPVGAVLPAMAQLDLPEWWLAGGTVRNTVWRSLFDDCALTINDFDLAFFDANGRRDQELAAKTILAEQFPAYVFDVKNQASFARWRSGRRTYSSTEDGIADWLHTATAVGVRCTTQGQWDYFTPYGLEDLFNGTIRPTPAHIHNPDAERKAASFLEKCACLRMGQVHR